MHETVRRYIKGLEEHHRKGDFLKELKALLEKHEITYEMEYLP